MSKRKLKEIHEDFAVVVVALPYTLLSVVLTELGNICEDRATILEYVLHAEDFDLEWRIRPLNHLKKSLRKIREEVRDPNRKKTTMEHINKEYPFPLTSPPKAKTLSQEYRVIKAGLAFVRDTNPTRTPISCLLKYQALCERSRLQRNDSLLSVMRDVFGKDFDWPPEDPPVKAGQHHCGGYPWLKERGGDDYEL